MARLVCLVQPTPTGASLTWSDGPAAFAPYELSAKALTAAADGARKALGNVVECFFSDDMADASAATVSLATSGFALYQALFKTPAEQQAAATEVRKWIDKLQSDDAVESMEIVSEGEIAVPWNLVYDQRPDPAAFKAGIDDPARWRPFWGLRHDLSGGRRVSPLRRLPVLHNPRVVVVTDPLVLDRLLTESRELATLCQENGWVQARSRQELADALQAGRPDVLYWLGHTQADPFGLVLGDDVITPDELKTLLEGDPFADAGNVFGGVAFLNACGTAYGDKSSSFLEVLHPLGLSGYIATEQVTVDTFAAPLGREFLSAFVVRGEPLGRVMRQLRGQVPLGLLYGSYCPSTIHVARESRKTVADTGPIVLTRAEIGTKLRRLPDESSLESYPLPPEPYRSLQSYGAADRALFAGRDDDTLHFAQLLDEPTTRLVILHGESGVGKTSFLRAGVIPYLERECPGYRFARDQSKDDTILLVRATNDPVGQIAAALTAYCSRPLVFRTPLGKESAADLPGALRSATGERSGRDALRDAFRADPALLGRLLAELSRRLPFTPVLVIDQAEEVFTLARTPADEANRNEALEMLRRAAIGPGGFKIVVSLRTEYQGRFTDRLRKGSNTTGGVREYLLTDFNQEALIEVIRRPTASTRIDYASEIPVEKYRFRYAPGVAEEIAKRARAYSINRSDSVLPLIQVICSQLYDRVRIRPEKGITLADLDAIGGVEGGMRAHAESLVSRLFPGRTDQRAFKRLMADPRTQLFIRQSDGTLTTALLPASFLARHWSGRMPFDEMLRTASDGSWRLIRVNSLRIGSDEEEQPYVSLGHDALAKVAARWQEEFQRWKQRRKFAAAALAGIAIAVTVILFQYQVNRRESELAQKQLDETKRRAGAREQFAELFAKADQAVTATRIEAIPWESVASDLQAANQLAKNDPEAFADWALKKSADELLSRANAALADASLRKAERSKLTCLGERHRDAVFFATLATGLGDAENLKHLREALEGGFAQFPIDLDGEGPPQFAAGYFTPEELRSITSRYYELLLIEAQVLATPIAGETVGALRDRLRQAIRRLDRADRLLPGIKTKVGLTRRSEYLAVLEKDVESKRFREEAEATNPVLAADYYLIAMEHYYRDEFGNAISPLVAALRIEAEHYGAQYLLAVCYMQLKRPQEAKIALARCLVLRPEFVWPRLFGALVEATLAREGVGNYLEAMADLDRVLKETQDEAVRYVALTNRGVLKYHRRNWDAAIADLQEAIRLRSDALPAYLNLAITYRDWADNPPPQVAALALIPGSMVAFAAATAQHRRHALDDAADILEKGIEHNPRVSKLYHERHQINLRRGNSGEARKDLVNAILYAPKFAGVISTLADDLLELGRMMQSARQHQDAIRVYGEILKTPEGQLPGEKRSLAARRLSASLLVLAQVETDAAKKKELYAKAAMALDLYLELTPVAEGLMLPRGLSGELAEALKFRGLIHAQLKSSREALDCYARSLGFRRNPEVLVLRGRAYLSAGAVKLGQKDFEEALALQPDDPDAHLGRAEAILKSGPYREALPDAEDAERSLAMLPADINVGDRVRLRYNAARVFAQIVIAEADPIVGERHLTRTASFLRQALTDLEPGDRAKFWQDAVLADPALGKLSVSKAIAAVGREFKVDMP